MSEAKIAHYQLVSRLGQGAMGVVFRARDERLQRDVALKLLQVTLEQGEAADYAARLLQEARSAARLNHPGIITVYDCGEWRGKPYLTMELVQGITLKALLDKRGKLAVKDVIALAKQMFSALSHAHAHGVVHRDIKPANLMLTQNGRLKITDFGIAQLPASDLTRTGTVLGSPRYMSPEQLGGQKIDGRADVYSVGVVLYQALTGQVPFDGEHTMSVIYNILHAEPTDPRQFTPEAPAWLGALILRCLAKSRDQRFASAEQALLGLQNPQPLDTPQESATLAASSTANVEPESSHTQQKINPPAGVHANSPLQRWVLQTIEMLQWLTLKLWALLQLSIRAMVPMMRWLAKQIGIWTPRLAAASWRGWCWLQPQLLRGGKKLGELGLFLGRKWLKWPRAAQWASGGILLLLITGGAWYLRPEPQIVPSLNTGQEENVVPDRQATSMVLAPDSDSAEPQPAKTVVLHKKAESREQLETAANAGSAEPQNGQAQPGTETSKSEISDLGNAIARNLSATQKQVQGSVAGLIDCLEGDAHCQKSNPPPQTQHRR